MELAATLAKHIRDVFTGGNWTAVNLQQTLEGISWQQALLQLHGCNNIATLVYHISYYVKLATDVLEGKPLNGHDSLSFNLPPMAGEDDWNALKQRAINNAEKLASLVAQLPDEKLDTVFVLEKYGTYYRNIQGIIEHTHYHLGQLSLLKKMIAAGA